MLIDIYPRLGFLREHRHTFVSAYAFEERVAMSAYVKLPTRTQQAVRTAYVKGWSSRDTACRLLADLGPAQPDVLLLFCGGKHPPEDVLASVRGAYPETVIAGGSAAGVISREGLGYSGLEIGALAISGSHVAPKVVTADGLGNGEYGVGLDLGKRVLAEAHPGAAILLFYASVAEEDPHRLHPAAPILAGFTAGLDGLPVNLSGAGLLTDLNFSDGWVFAQGEVLRHGAFALLFPPTVTLSSTIFHGCRPVSSFMHITKVEGAKVMELDGMPALGVLENKLGLALGGASGRSLSLIATLGQKLGDPYAPFSEAAYVNRLILGADRIEGSITLFEPDFPLGARVQVMARDNDLMLRSARQGVAATNDAIGAAGDIAFCLYIDCAGRVSGRSGAAEEEASIVASTLDPGVQFLGFFSGVEIAPVGPDFRALDWTGVLVTLRVSYG